ncbi:hypothetical protein HOV43_gp060 [Escherichia phage vB_EcoM_KWBSE43-6]|uniref:Uncharacterized protein n=2 Tax=Taipeivirus TaxID=2731621 RepID=A0A5Q2F710_9CAUD|nr:hypothetical protein HOV43_gp060 [Escherichia phage vB_EcoM_KWBSE43-6]YP_009884653.1 hypothetical protein HYQ02_gp059 [Klebsiella phage UPM 2146]QBQ78888.1 hypothetical protein KWBSE43_00060 [Escherichia phage vB_EcoM_KWBSE43-6]QGF20577.1 hypothetical protein [Klebsiella phage UPM 2146]
MKDVTDDQLKEMWRQTQIIAHKKMKTIRALENELGELTKDSTNLEVELIKRGYVVKRRFWEY